MKVAVVGGGVSGLVAAHHLAGSHEVQVFEAADRIGGHTHTHNVELDGRQYAVDTGFIVFNEHNYPSFCTLMRQLDVDWQVSDMSFSSRNERTGLEYKAHTLLSLFSQRRNLLRPPIYRLLRDILRFYREVPSLLASDDPGPTTGDYLLQERYSQVFVDDHLIPMASALWSAPPQQILQFPLRYMVQFFANHKMLQLKGRPEWRVIKGGSSSYIKPLIKPFADRIHCRTAISNIRRCDEGVTLTTESGDQVRVDRVVLACHSDQALAILEDPTEHECDVLGAIKYQSNDITLHTDQRVLPKQRRAWSAWNALVPKDPDAPCTVTYNMNILQSLESPRPFCVSLNSDDRIDSAHVIKKLRYQHPIYTHEAVAAQRQRDQISGSSQTDKTTYYCGAYWGFGFHEDGVRSGLDVARECGIHV